MKNRFKRLKGQYSSQRRGCSTELAIVRQMGLLGLTQEMAIAGDRYTACQESAQVKFLPQCRADRGEGTGETVASAAAIQVGDGLAAPKQPRFVAEIYGLFFSFHRLLPISKVVKYLNMSKASASLGLKCLQDPGAVQRWFTSAVTGTCIQSRNAKLRNLAGRFCASKFSPILRNTASKLTAVPTSPRLSRGERKCTVARVKGFILGTQRKPLVL